MVTEHMFWIVTGRISIRTVYSRIYYPLCETCISITPGFRFRYVLFVFFNSSVTVLLRGFSLRVEVHIYWMLTCPISNVVHLWVIWECMPTSHVSEYKQIFRYRRASRNGIHLLLSVLTESCKNLHMWGIVWGSVMKLFNWSPDSKLYWTSTSVVSVLNYFYNFPGTMWNQKLW